MEMISSASKMDSFLSFVKTEDFEFSSECGFINPGDTALEQMIHTEKTLSLSPPFDLKSCSENSFDEFNCIDTNTVIEPDPDPDCSDYEAVLAKELSSINNGTMDNGFVSVELELVLNRRDLEHATEVNVADNKAVLAKELTSANSGTLDDVSVELELVLNHHDLNHGAEVNNADKSDVTVDKNTRNLDDGLDSSLFTNCSGDNSVTEKLPESELQCTNITDSYSKENAKPAISIECSKSESDSGENRPSYNEMEPIEKRSIVEEPCERKHKKLKRDKSEEMDDEKRIKDAVEKVKQKLARQKETKLKEKRLKYKDREAKIWEKVRLLSQKIAHESASFARSRNSETDRKFPKKFTSSDPIAKPFADRILSKRSSGEISLLETPMPTSPMTPSYDSPDNAVSPSSVCSKKKSLNKKITTSSPLSKRTKLLSEKHQTSPPYSDTNVVEVIKNTPELARSKQLSLLRSPAVRISLLNLDKKSTSFADSLKFPRAMSADTIRKLKQHGALTKPRPIRPLQTSLLRASSVACMSKTSRAEPVKVTSPLSRRDMIRKYTICKSSQPCPLPNRITSNERSIVDSRRLPAASKNLSLLMSAKSVNVEEGDSFDEAVRVTMLEQEQEITKECSDSRETEGSSSQMVNEKVIVLAEVPGVDQAKLSKETKKRINLSEYKNRLIERLRNVKVTESVKLVKPANLNCSLYLKLEHNYCLTSREIENDLKSVGHTNVTSEAVAAVSAKEVTSSGVMCLAQGEIMPCMDEQAIVCVPTTTSGSSNIDLLPNAPDVTRSTSMPVSNMLSAVFASSVTEDRNHVNTASSQSMIINSEYLLCKQDEFVSEVNGSGDKQPLVVNSVLPFTNQSDLPEVDNAPPEPIKCSISSEKSACPMLSSTDQDRLSYNSLTLGYVLSKVAKSASKREAASAMESNAGQLLPSEILSLRGVSNSPKQPSLFRYSSDLLHHGNSSERETCQRTCFAQRQSLRRNYRRRSSSSDSSSRSRSRSPVRQQSFRRHGRSERSRSRSSSFGSRFSGSRKTRDFDDNRRWASICREERHVIFVGGIPSDFTKYDLIKKFGHFGEVVSTSVHHPKDRDSYGFVKFSRTEDADRLKSEGHSVSGCQDFQFSYGGRRGFCKVGYADLDDEYKNWDESQSRSTKSTDFDSLLKETLKLQKKTLRS